MQRIVPAILFVLTTFALVGCQQAEQPADRSHADRPESETTGVALTADVFADTDIQQMEFVVEAANCETGELLDDERTKIVDYEDMYLPGDIPAFEKEPYDEDSAHMFADAYFTLDAGCWNVTTQPLREDELDSEDCRPAHASGVQVQDGKTTEILLVNQCEGDARGGLDVLGTINHPPEIGTLEFADSKFVTTCGPQRICMTASDPDSDPLEFEFATTEAPQSGSITPVGDPSYDSETGLWTACADVDIHEPGEYGFVARVFDLDGNGRRIEAVLADQDGPQDLESRDRLAFPMYSDVTCSSDAGPRDADDNITLPFDTGVEPVDDTGVEPSDDTGTPPAPDTDVDDETPDADTGTTAGCTRTRGYWSNHYDGASSPGRDIDWPAPMDEADQLCGVSLLELVGSNSAGGDPAHQLAAQWIAASLNVASGASAPAPIPLAIDEAEALLESSCFNTPAEDEQYAESLKDLLDAYNNGNIGPGHCK